MKENVSKQKPTDIQGKTPTRVIGGSFRSPSIVADAKLIKQNADLNSKVNALGKNVVELEKERDFYFGKLRDIEIMLQAHDEKPSNERDDASIFKDLFKVLYASAEDELVVDNDGKLTGAFLENLGEEGKPFDEQLTSSGEEPVFSPTDSEDKLFLEIEDPFLPTTDPSIPLSN